MPRHHDPGGALVKRALPANQLVGEEHEGAAWTRSRRWTPEARETARQRMIERRPWLLWQREPVPFERAGEPLFRLDLACAAFVVDPEPAPLLRGVPFPFNLDIDQ